MKKTKKKFFFCFGSFSKPAFEQKKLSRFFSKRARIGIFQRKKNTHHNLVLVLTKKIPARKNEVSVFVRGKLLVIFGLCNPHISQKEASGNFESMTTFALLIEIYLT
jgi:hypothetical protein